MSVEDPITVANYDHYNTIQKNCVLLNIWDLKKKSNCSMNFLEMTLSKCFPSTTNPLGSISRW
jgi:hypothetical protein